jgi:hypothetical protein
VTPALLLVLALGVPDVQAGDLVFHTSRSSQASAIFAATKSPYTHVGLVVRDPAGDLVVFEAKKRAGFTPLQAFLARGVNGRYAVFRPPLDDAQRARLHAEARALVGRPYDLHFAPDEARVYCSEAVDLVLRAVGVELGGWRPTGELDLDAPAVKALFARRWRGHPACAGLTSARACRAKVEPVLILTPADQAAAPSLRLVTTTYP